MGLGKSLQALRFARNLDTTVVVCPASLKHNWEREALIHNGVGAEVLEGRTVPKRRMITPHPVVIINYDILGPWLSYLTDLAPKCIIIDEVHYLKNRGTQRTKAVKKLCKDVPHVIGLSGTPLTNRPAELWPILNIIRPDKFKAFMPFAQKYCQPRRRPWGWEFKGATNIPQLHDELKDVMIRRRKADVLKDLPAKSRYVVPMDLSDWDDYQHASNDLIAWLGATSTHKAKQARKAERLVRYGYLKRLAARHKYWSVIDWIDSFMAESERKLVLMAVHKKLIRWLREYYTDSCVVVDGSTASRKRQIAVDKFTRDKKTRLFIGNIQAAGVGLNLQHAASDLAFAELGWTPGEHNQAEDRIHRLGQTMGASIYYLIARGTIEDELCSLIQKKQQVLDGVLDGRQVQSFDLFDMLEKRMVA